MNLARITTNGQVTVPVEIRRELSLNPGSKVIFYKNRDGEIVIDNASINALKSARKALEDYQTSDEEILDTVMDIRYTREGKKCE